MPKGVRTCAFGLPNLLVDVFVSKGVPLMLASLYAAGVCLVMLFSVQAMLQFDVGAEFGTVGEYVSKAACYALTVVFFAGFVVETGRLLVAA